MLRPLRDFKVPVGARAIAVLNNTGYRWDGDKGWLPIFENGPAFPADGYYAQQGTEFTPLQLKTSGGGRRLNRRDSPPVVESPPESPTETEPTPTEGGTE